MDITFYSHRTFEDWDYTNPDLVGIGGSEISHIELSSRLAQRHHNIISYAPVPFDGIRDHRGVTWMSYKKVDVTRPGYWFVYRYPTLMDNFPEKHPDQIIYYIAQDTHYPDMTEERAAKFDHYVCLSAEHANYTARKYPYVRDKIIISSNGISVDKIRSIETDNKIVRNNQRLIWVSSPDRGLDTMLSIFPRLLEFFPDIELHIFYGFDNIDKFLEFSPMMQNLKDNIFDKIKKYSNNIFWHGRQPQERITKEFLKSGLWVYPTEATETSCIACMEAQALGAIPVTNPKWALAQNVQHGVFIEGNVSEDKLLQCMFIGEIVRLLNDPELMENIRKEMMPWARVVFNWERYVDQIESWMYDFPHVMPAQYCFQHKHAFGKIINIGSDIDSSGLKKYRNATNLDALKYNEYMKRDNVVDIVADIRDRKFITRMAHGLYELYDCAILGDILEHFSERDAITALWNARMLIKHDGRIIITLPDDARSSELQGSEHTPVDPSKMYIQHEEGGPFDPVMTYHYRRFFRNDINKMLDAAYLRIKIIETIDYTHFKGWGIVAECA